MKARVEGANANTAADPSPADAKQAGGFGPGARSVSFGRDAKGATIVTGDNNKVGPKR